VELLYGVLDTEGLITEPVKLLMAPVGGKKKGATQFTAALTCETSGRYGYTVRIMPTHPQLSDPFKMGLMHWA